MKLIVGLGNPGKEYINTRHNIGFDFVDNISQKLSFQISQKKFGGLYGEAIIESEKVIFLKPQKYMNLSGEVIKPFIDYFKIGIEDVLIISDDLDMDCGKIKFKTNGSSGGHNGLKNIEQHLKTKEYKRLKIGVSNNKEIDTCDYVLGCPKKEEREQLDLIINSGPDIIKDYLNLSFENLMNKYNR